MTSINFEQSDLTPRPYAPAHFDDHRTAPLLVSGAEAKKRYIWRQNRILRHFIELALYEIPQFSTDSVAEHVSKRIGARIHQVEGMNANIYNYERLNETPDLLAGWPDVSPRGVARACRRAKAGRGTVAENLISIKANGMPSGGIAELTIIGNQRLHLEEPMLEEVGEEVGEDVTPRFDQMTNLRVLGFHQYDIKSIEPENFGALCIGMKRHLGTLPNGIEVKSRTVAHINTNPDYGLNRDDLKEIINGSVKFDSRVNRFEHIQNLDMSRNAAFVRVLKWLVDEKMQPGTVLARNESVYGVDPAAQKLVAARRLKMP